MILGRLGLDIHRESPALAFDSAVAGNKPQVGGLGIKDAVHGDDLAGFDAKLLPDQRLAPERLLVVIEQLVELRAFKAGRLGQFIQHQHNGRRVAGNVRVHVFRGNQAEPRHRVRRAAEHCRHFESGRGTGREQAQHQDGQDGRMGPA